MKITICCLNSWIGRDEIEQKFYCTVIVDIDCDVGLGICMLQVFDYEHLELLSLMNYMFFFRLSADDVI